MRRRDFLRVIGSAATAWPLTVRAQQPERMRRIGVLVSFGEKDPEGQARTTAFRNQLGTLGWYAGDNLQIDYRWITENGRSQTGAAELVALKPEVILAYGGPILAALRDETRTIPIVFVQMTAPVELGFVASLSHPGGNITGFTNFEYSLGGKWLETLKEIAPGVSRVMPLSNPLTPTSSGFLRDIEIGAHRLAVQYEESPVRDAADINKAIESFARESDGGLVILPDTTTFTHRDLIISLAARYRLPAIYPLRLFNVTGGLITYGVDQIDQSRKAASYVDRILKGAKPADLPVQAPTKFELIVNLKTAKALGLTVPQSILVRTDEVIE